MKDKFDKLFQTGLILIAVAGGFNKAGAQALSSASLQNPFDSAGASARAMALGGAFVGVADDSSALFFNPAGLAGLKGTDLALHHQVGLSGISQDLLALGTPLGPGLGLGFSGQFINYGSFDGWLADGTPAPGYSAYQAGGGVGGGVEIAKGLALGAALEATFQQLASNSYVLFNGNAGLLYSIPQGWRFGVSYEGWGTAASGGTAASVVRVGASKTFSSKGPLGILAALSYTYEPQFGSEVLAGVEGTYHSNYFLRAGYQLNLQETGLNGLQGLTAGAGLAVAGFQLDYAFIPFADLGNTHRLSLSYRFGTENPNSSTRAKAVGHPAASATAEIHPQPAGSQTDPSLTLQFELPSPQVTQGAQLEREGKLKEAIEAYLGAVKANSQNIQAWWRLGNLYYRLHYKDYAVQCFEQVLKLKPEDKALADWLGKYKTQDQ